jgi:hypothetical protein
VVVEYAVVSVPSGSLPQALESIKEVSAVPVISKPLLRRNSLLEIRLSLSLPDSEVEALIAISSLKNGIINLTERRF